MIQAQSIIGKMEASLDAEGSDRYLFDQDYKPAINESISWLVSVFNKAFGDNKLPEENLRDLTYNKIFQANGLSRINLDLLSNVNHKLWTVIGVSPKPVVYPATTPPLQASIDISVLRTDLSYVKSEYSATRLSAEAWNKNISNIFMPGNEVLKNKFTAYAYQNPFNNGSTSYASAKEIEIRPSVAGEFVSVSYLKRPDLVTVPQSVIEFPETVEEILFQKALNFISYKQGDRTNLYSVTAQDVMTLVKLMS